MDAFAEIVEAMVDGDQENTMAVVDRCLADGV
jgi:hypothetical protein